VDFIEKVLSGEIRFNTGNLSERLDILNGSLRETFEQLSLAFQTRFPSIPQEFVENHLETYVQSNITTNMDNYQLNEIISFIGQLLVFLPQSEWSYFLSFMTSQAVTESHHHLHLLFAVWSEITPIQIYEEFVGNLSTTSSVFDGLNQSFDTDFIKESLKWVSETNALAQTNDIAANRELALNTTTAIVDEHTRAVEEVTERALAQLHEGNLFQNIRNFFWNNPAITFPVVLTLIGTIIRYRDPIITIGRELFSNENSDPASNIAYY
jgi:hypothetical protein